MKLSVITDRTTAALEDFWCSDCLSGELFERIGDSATGSEWVCTSCGAGYFDALDRVLVSGAPAAPAHEVA